MNPVGSDACSSLEDAIVAVEDGADASVLAGVVGRLLRDRHSFRFWVRQVRAFAVRGRLRAFADAVRRVLVDVQEGFARSAAALLVARLKGGDASATAEPAQHEELGGDLMALEDLLPLPVVGESVPAPSPRVAVLLASLEAALAAPGSRASAAA